VRCGTVPAWQWSWAEELAKSQAALAQLTDRDQMIAELVCQQLTAFHQTLGPFYYVYREGFRLDAQSALVATGQWKHEAAFRGEEKDYDTQLKALGQERTRRTRPSKNQSVALPSINCGEAAGELWSLLDAAGLLPQSQYYVDRNPVPLPYQRRTTACLNHAYLRVVNQLGSTDVWVSPLEGIVTTTQQALLERYEASMNLPPLRKLFS
jgi:hypothetical protein